MSKPTPARTSKPVKREKAREYLSQQDVPGLSLDKALRIPRAIAENYGNGPATPLEVASALNVSPSTGPFRGLTGASIAYGLTKGASNASHIEITPLGMRIVKPTIEHDDVEAKREALLKPRVLREFLQKYDNAQIPRSDIAQNVLGTLGVPTDRTAEVLQLILEGAESVGFVRSIKDKKYIDLKGTKVQLPSGTNVVDLAETRIEAEAEVPEMVAPVLASSKLSFPSTPALDARSRKVFITHGKNKEFIEPIKKLLSFGELEAVVAAEKQTVSQPVPEKVMEDMRSCGAAIIHVTDERHLMDKEAKEHVVLNENVLIEIGAAMALYGRRFILVVKDGVTLPSNLQGLYEVRYSSETLDGGATIKLMEAINDLKKRPLPL
jgi:predicted nucleotide-binding protein